jgi:hypothetical protein
MPVRVKASIQSGRLGLGPLQFDLPIRGEGMFEVMYLDSKLRIFKSGAQAVVVQVRQG